MRILRRISGRVFIGLGFVGFVFAAGIYTSLEDAGLAPTATLLVIAVLCLTSVVGGSIKGLGEQLKEEPRRKHRMYRGKICLAIAAIATVACAGPISNSGPRASHEFFVERNADGRLGLLSNEGTTSLELIVYDEANRPIMRAYIPPAQDRRVSLDGNRLRIPQLYQMALPPGSYRIQYIGFYYRDRFVFPQGLVRERIDFPRGGSGFTVMRDAYAVYDDRTKRHWGWVVRLHGGDMPLDSFVDQFINNIRSNVSISCC